MHVDVLLPMARLPRLLYSLTHSFIYSFLAFHGRRFHEGRKTHLNPKKPNRLREVVHDQERHARETISRPGTPDGSV